MGFPRFLRRIRLCLISLWDWHSQTGDREMQLGGDNAFGLDLGDRSLWVFGDTYLGPVDQQRSNTRVAGNTIAIVGQPTYYYKGTPQRPLAFFPDPLPGYRFWPQKIISYAGKLFVFLSLRQGAAAITAASFVARINNPNSDPRDWLIDYLGIVLGNELQVGDEAIMTDAGLEVFGTYNHSTIARGVVVRIKQDALLSTPNFTWIAPSKIDYLADKYGPWSGSKKAVIHRFQASDAIYYGIREWGVNDKEITFTYTIGANDPVLTETNNQLYQVKSITVPHPF